MMNLNENFHKAADKNDYKQNTPTDHTFNPTNLNSSPTFPTSILNETPSTTILTENYFEKQGQQNILPSIQTIPPSDNSETFDDYSGLSDHLQICSNIASSTESFNEDSFLNTCSKKKPELKSFFNNSNDLLLKKEKLKLKNRQYKQLLDSFFKLVSSISTIDYDFISTKNKPFHQKLFKKSLSLDFSFFKKHGNLLEDYYENAAYMQNQSVFSHLFLKSLIEKNTKILGDIHNQFSKNFFHKKLLKTFGDNKKQNNGFSHFYNSGTPSRKETHRSAHEKQRNVVETNKKHMNTEKKSYETKIVIYSRDHSDSKKHKRRSHLHKPHSDSSDLSDLISVRSNKRPSLSYTRDSLRSSRFKKSFMSHSSSSKSLRSIFDPHTIRLNKKPMSRIGRINHQVGTVLRVTFLISMISATLGIVFSVLGFVEMEGWNNTKKLVFKIIGPTLLMSTLVAWLVGGMFWWLWRSEWRKEKQELEMKSRVKLHALALKLLKNSHSNVASSSSFLPSDDRIQRELMAKMRRNSSLRPR